MSSLVAFLCVSLLASTVVFSNSGPRVGRVGGSGGSWGFRAFRAPPLAATALLLSMPRATTASAPAVAAKNFLKRYIGQKVKLSTRCIEYEAEDDSEHVMATVRSVGNRWAYFTYEEDGVPEAPVQLELDEVMEYIISDEQEPEPPTCTRNILIVHGNKGSSAGLVSTPQGKKIPDSPLREIDGIDCSKLLSHVERHQDQSDSKFIHDIAARFSESIRVIDDARMSITVRKVDGIGAAESVGTTKKQRLFRSVASKHRLTALLQDPNETIVIVVQTSRLDGARERSLEDDAACLSPIIDVLAEDIPGDEGLYGGRQEPPPFPPPRNAQDARGQKGKRRRSQDKRGSDGRSSGGRGRGGRNSYYASGDDDLDGCFDGYAHDDDGDDEFDAEMAAEARQQKQEQEAVRQRLLKETLTGLLSISDKSMKGQLGLLKQCVQAMLGVDGVSFRGVQGGKEAYVHIIESRMRALDTGREWTDGWRKSSATSEHLLKPPTQSLLKIDDDGFKYLYEHKAVQKYLYPVPRASAMPQQHANHMPMPMPNAQMPQMPHYTMPSMPNLMPQYGNQMPCQMPCQMPYQQYSMPSFTSSMPPFVNPMQMPMQMQMPTHGWMPPSYGWMPNQMPMPPPNQHQMPMPPLPNQHQFPNHHQMPMPPQGQMPMPNANANYGVPPGAVPVHAGGTNGYEYPQEYPEPVYEVPANDELAANDEAGALSDSAETVAP